MFLLALPYLGQWYADVNKKITRWSRNDDGLSNGKGGRGGGGGGVAGRPGLRREPLERGCVGRIKNFSHLPRRRLGLVMRVRYRR